MDILFKNLNLLKQTEDALEELNFAHPTPIQALVIPEIINGHDVIAQSQTGTGKTFSFGIPIIEKIDPKLAKIQSLILCPTRELALQVFLEIKKLVRFNRSIKAIVVYGGESYIKQFKDLETKPHIVIATPGRMIDLLNRKKIVLSSVKILTLDEADEMLKMGFKDDLETILSSIPTERQTILFSATMPAFIKEIATKYQKEPKIIKVKKDSLAVKAIEQFYFLVKDFDKNKLLVRLLDQKNSDSVIIFANTKRDVDDIFNYLQEKDFLVDAIHGDLKQNQRKYVMNNFRKNSIKILVATDVAARGIDISDVKIIINYDLPHEDEVYVHRIGRTGRAGKTGIAYSFISPKKIHQLRRLEQYLKEKIIHLNIPTVEEVQKEQNNFFQDKIASLVTENQNKQKTLHPLVDVLLEKLDSKEIISALVESVMPNKKNYESIVEPTIWNNNRTNNMNSYNKFNNNPYYKTKNNYNSNRNNYANKTNYNNNYSRPSAPMAELTINLGKEDGMNPAIFLKLLKDKFNIFGKNVGNIKHLHNKTIFEIAFPFAKRIQFQNNIYYENKLLQIQSK